MKRSLAWLAFASTIVWLTASLAAAQGYAPVRAPRRPQYMQRPAVSPYLNLIQFQDSAADDSMPVYQNLVRPFVEQRRINQYQVNQVFQLQQQVARAAAETNRYEGLRQTGHLTSYQNMSHFYPNLAPRR